MKEPAKEPVAELRMYATVWCLDCARARRLLKARGVAWKELDVDQDPAAEARVLKRNAGSRVLPVFEYRGHWTTVAPFDREKLLKWLGEAGLVTR
jgi:mycoredoxin